MKKIVLAIMMMGLVATSYGVVNIDWSAAAGFWFSADPAVGILGDATGNSTVAQLIYSADGIQDAVPTVGTYGNIDVGGAFLGDDVLWQQVTITENGISADFDDFAAFTGNYAPGTSTLVGNVYAIIFQDSVIDGNDWYYYTPMVLVQDIATGSPNQVLSMNTDNFAGDAIDAPLGTTVGQVIPEPATMLLFGIGGFGAWLLRRRQQA